MAAIIFLKNYVSCKLHLVHKTALNPLVERTTEAEHGLEGYFKSVYRWQLNFELAKNFSSIIKRPFERQYSTTGAKCEWKEKIFFTLCRV